MILYNEDNAELKDAREWQEADTVIIKFDDNEDSEIYCEISISEDEIKFISENINFAQRSAVIEYAESAQLAIIDYLVFLKDDEETKDYLNRTAHN